MSVWVSAFLSHNWPSFSSGVIEEIARLNSEEVIPARWRGHPTFQSPEAEFAADGNVLFFLPGDFTVGFGKSIMLFKHADRWSTFLIQETLRQKFLSACKRVAHFAGSKEILIVPEGTVLLDHYYSGTDFDNVKRDAYQKWGPPDLDIDHIYSEDQLNGMANDRVHYFLVEGDA